ncbi:MULTISPECIES: anti-sigma B factor RsbW [Bacillus]|uniref:anti-sigma B factor RsbW n=1 Tax=Bacillus TaxID=1386 RepID=UPI0004110F22|nr:MULTISPECIES: anti-sigma B factor RsbW [Bacillus]QHZ48517.1 anti-sigma B factor RsbW [Bacillus sp. NSP9.1]WFA05847.1 anti-sigma B factor RsbW [Bacillus sp. HSf4]
MKTAVDYIEMKSPAKPEYVGIVRLTLSGIASKMGYSYDDIEDLKIAVSEACTNAVQHAYQADKQGEVSVRFGVFEDRLEIVVADQGDSFDICDKQEALGPYSPEHTADQLSEGGLGLYLMETLMDEVNVQINSGVTVSMTKFLNRERVDDGTTVQKYETN